MSATDTQQQLNANDEELTEDAEDHDAEPTVNAAHSLVMVSIDCMGRSASLCYYLTGNR